MNLANFQITITDINPADTDNNGIIKGKATFLNHKINIKANSTNYQELQRSVGKEIQVEATIYNSNFDLKILQITNSSNQDEIEQLTNSYRELQHKLEQIRQQVTTIAQAKIRDTVKAKYVDTVHTINEIVS